MRRQRIDDLLELSRIELGGQVLQGVVDVHEVHRLRLGEHRAGPQRVAGGLQGRREEEQQGQGATHPAGKIINLISLC